MQTAHELLDKATCLWGVLPQQCNTIPTSGVKGRLVEMVVHCCEFRPSCEAAVNLFSDAAAAVRKVYQEMDPALNIIVVFDKKWLTRGHTSHIGVGTLRASHKTGP